MQNTLKFFLICATSSTATFFFFFISILNRQGIVTQMLSYDIACPVNDVVLFTKNSLATTVVLYNDIRICMYDYANQANCSPNKKFYRGSHTIN